jgi:PAS domain-containing protein
LRNDPEFLLLVASSYSRLAGSVLIPKDVGSVDAARWLYEDAPFCVLAHNREPDPRFIYANRAAQDRFEYSWDEFTSLPSRLSAEEVNREDRQRLLDAVTRDGMVTDYRGMRIAKSGRRFWIENGTVWQLTDLDGAHRGQAALFQR